MLAEILSGIMERKINEWLNKTGFPFELWTESTLSKNSFKTLSSSIYEDEENEIFREIDLIGIKNWESEDEKTIFSIELVIECKKSEKPFILLCNNNSEDCEISIGQYYNLDEPTVFLLMLNPNKFIKLPQKNNSGFKLIQGFVNGDETINKAINTIIKSFKNSKKISNELIDSHIQSNYNQIIIPLLLIDAQFYEAKINNSEIELYKIESGILNVYSHLANSGLEPFPIPIVTKSAFEEFLNEIEKFGKSYLNFLKNNPKLNVSNLPNVEIKLESK